MTSGRTLNDESKNGLITEVLDLQNDMLSCNANYSLQLFGSMVNASSIFFNDSIIMMCGGEDISLDDTERLNDCCYIQHLGKFEMSVAYFQDRTRSRISMIGLNGKINLTSKTRKSY